jgi:D-alanyl-D-alanine carboxypeptidase
VPQSQVGVYVHDLHSDRVVLSVGADRAFNPASVVKLVTTFAALELLAPGTWKTHAAGLVQSADAGVGRLPAAGCDGRHHEKTPGRFAGRGPGTYQERLPRRVRAIIGYLNDSRGLPLAVALLTPAQVMPGPR